MRNQWLTPHDDAHDPQRLVAEDHKITIHSVRYYDAAGVLVESQLAEPRELSPPSGSRGGAGANFLVGWTGALGPAPLVEALMAGHQGAGRLTFTSRGVEVGLDPGEAPL